MTIEVYYKNLKRELHRYVSYYTYKSNRTLTIHTTYGYDIILNDVVNVNVLT